MLAALCTTTLPQTRESATLFLDLTAPIPQEERLTAMPGAGFGVIGGQPVPPGYSLPLAVELLSISPQPLSASEKCTAEVLLRNTGKSVFYLPASQKSASVLKQGNSGRRTFLFSLVFEDPASGERTSLLGASSHASEAVPSSWLHLDPGQSVRVRFEMSLDELWGWRKAHLKQVRVGAEVLEWKFEDKRYFIASDSEHVLSTNTLTVDVAWPN